ncbi:MAG: glutathione S-transferase [Burkholderiaceae bacterium]|nr:glutathione S-transferase [Burkholderiaceae bacterium]
MAERPAPAGGCRPLDGLARHRADAGHAATEPLLAILDEHLAGRHFLCAQQFTVADIAVGASVHRWFGLPQKHAARPNVQGWYRRLMTRPAVAGVLTLPIT